MRYGDHHGSLTRIHLDHITFLNRSVAAIEDDIAETGLDMTRFATAGHLVSWAGLAPVARQSGPRSRKPGKGQGDSYLRGYCTQAATGAATTDTFLGERLRRLSRLLASPEARYTELGPGWHARKTDTDRRTRSLLNQLRALHPDSDITITAA